MSELRRVALVGLPGSGKTTIAPLLARRLTWGCIDLDAEVAAAAGRTPAEIIDRDGEDAFRDRELAALEATLRRDGHVVIACGGGLIAQERARGMLTEMCCVVWLDAPDEVLLRRLRGGPRRPLLGDDPEAALPRLRARRAAAHRSAHVRVDARGTPDAVAGRIAGLLDGAVRVAVPGGAYHVEVRPGALDDAGAHVPSGASRVVVVADRAVPAATRAVAAALRREGIDVTVVRVAAGESLKTWASAGRLLARLGAAGLTRQDCVVAVGGGTVGDVTGFVASVHLRGIAWIDIPTTLLAMVDSAVGGKTGVNLARGKNLAGAFWQPSAVICDPDVLTTQPERSYRADFAEIVKYAMIGDGCFAGALEGRIDSLLRRDVTALTETVRGCVAIKAGVVADDVRDQGRRAVLNYGHTVGHAVEAATGFGALLHGEAVALGMRVAGRLSVLYAGCPAEDIAWQDTMLRRCGLPPDVDVDRRRVLDLLAADKKVVGDRVGWVLLEARGRPCFGQHVPEPSVERALEEVLRR